MSDDIQAKLAGYITKDILRQPNRVIEPDQALLSSGLVNSFSLVDLAMYIEDTFNVRIEDFELNKDTFDSLAQLANLIRSRQ
jgi:acyl carrier protein